MNDKYQTYLALSMRGKHTLGTIGTPPFFVQKRINKRTIRITQKHRSFFFYNYCDCSFAHSSSFLFVLCCSPCFSPPLSTWLLKILFETSIMDHMDVSNDIFSSPLSTDNHQSFFSPNKQQSYN